ncbi:hypothetical protein NPIL_56221 [Nephila pilipes]|uniref:Uncharacterized protein n=1 Tax=Nephila pilipes TaxID=299642 RepID=A0A8X6NZX4_NEPPI|nr:hypothetical protein NPIL_56221 [Nephila pilipes]
MDDTRVGYGSDLERDKAAVGTGADGICSRYVEHNRLHHQFPLRCNHSSQDRRLFPSAEGDHAEHGYGPPASGKVGRLGPHPHRRRTVRYSQHIQFPEVSVHLLCESPPGSLTDLLGADGDRHRQVLLRV